jgi:phosphoribosylamine--glycine ligase
MQADWDPRAAVGVVMAAAGYPGAYSKGEIISGLPQMEEEGLKIFHAGTVEQAGRVVTSGGRVLCATALGDSVSEAQTLAYNLAKRVSWKGVFYRTDIGYRAIARERG